MVLSDLLGFIKSLIGQALWFGNKKVEKSLALVEKSIVDDMDF
jgi:hypothetical protein